MPRLAHDADKTIAQNYSYFSTLTASPAAICSPATTKKAGVDPEHRDALLCGPVTYLPPPRGGEGYSAALEPMIGPHPARPAPRDGDVIASTDYELFWSLSFALTSFTWRTVGGFFERYRGYGAEDTDFAQTARAAGVPMRWVGGAHAFHQFHSVADPPVRTPERHHAQRHGFPSAMGLVADGRWLDAFEQRGMITRDTECRPTLAYTQ